MAEQIKIKMKSNALPRGMPEITRNKCNKIILLTTLSSIRGIKLIGIAKLI
jgi:hypothetical protein